MSKQKYSAKEKYLHNLLDREHKRNNEKDIIIKQLNLELCKYKEIHKEIMEKCETLQMFIDCSITNNISYDDMKKYINAINSLKDLLSFSKNFIN